MDNTKKEETVKRIEELISKMETKDFNVYFFVLDTKGNANSLLEYEYDLAYNLKDMGYNVTMLHQEKEFVGVKEWLGEKYSEIPHKNVETDNVEIAPCDFLFIPEVFANVMAQTKSLPCTRIAIFTNTDYLTEFIPVGATWSDFNINNAVTTSEMMKKKLEAYFPNVIVSVIPPSIKNVFRNTDEPKKLIVNIVSKDQSFVNKVVKPFYWKFPVYKWISFRDLRGLNQETFANALREAAITIWSDETTDFGASGIETLKSGSILCAKLPTEPTEWMLDEKGELRNDILWFDDVENVHTMLASVVRAWTKDEIPSEFTSASEKEKETYSENVLRNGIKQSIVDGYFDTMIGNYRQILAALNNKEEEKEESNE